MGINAQIYLKTKDGKQPALDNLPPNECEILEAPDWVEGATHEVDQLLRYYDKGNERGPWPVLSQILHSLFDCPAVEKVWYFPDSIDNDAPITRERVVELDEHYKKFGNRPYLESLNATH